MSWPKGRKRSPETLAKLSAAARTLWSSEEHRAKVSAALKGRTLTPEHRANISAGKLGKPRPDLKGIPLLPEHRAKIALSKLGPRNPNWKDSDIQYQGLHSWINRHGGRASSHLCASCLEPAYDWANLSGEYLRELDDFIPLCRSCHTWFDMDSRSRNSQGRWERNHATG